MTTLFATLLIQTSLILAQTNQTQPTAATPSQPICVRAGCNGELCIPRSELGDVDSICVALPAGEDTCYKAAVCAKNKKTSGCGWVDQRALEKCLSKARGGRKS